MHWGYFQPFAWILHTFASFVPAIVQNNSLHQTKTRLQVDQKKKKRTNDISASLLSIIFFPCMHVLSGNLFLPSKILPWDRESKNIFMFFRKQFKHFWPKKKNNDWNHDWITLTPTPSDTLWVWTIFMDHFTRFDCSTIKFIAAHRITVFAHIS